MKKRRSIGMMAAAFAMAIAGSLGTAQTTQAYVPGSQHQRTTGGEMKATAPTKSTRHRSVLAQSGGLDVIKEGGVFGMTPKEYGMRFGNGKSRNAKVNYVRMSHNAKVKKRRAR